MTENPAKPEKKPKIWRGQALYIPLAAVLVTAFVVAALVLISSCEAVKCESALTVVSSISAAYLVFCVCAIYTAHCFQLGGSEDERQKIINSALSFVALFLVIMGAVDAYTTKYYIGDEQLALEAWVGGILAMWGLLLLGQRTKNQSKQLKIQTEQLKIQTQELENQNEEIKSQANKEIDDRFIAAVKSLGSNESSARTGAVYFLYELAMESKKYRKQIAQILCSHIRSKTQEKEYQAEHKKRPSNEIQTAIDILFKDVNGVKGLYCHDFAQESKFPRANLSYAYLCGANFTNARCQGADFSYSRCYNALFHYAQCQKGSFFDVKCIGAFFIGARLYGAYFDFAECQGAFFECAECQGAFFGHTNFHCADFSGAQCQGADFYLSCFQSVSANEAINFSGAYSESKSQSLEGRIGLATEIKNVVFEGEWSFPCVEEIEAAKSYFPNYWYKHIKSKMDAHKNEKESNKMPELFTAGVLEDSEEIRKIAAEIRKWTR